MENQSQKAKMHKLLIVPGRSGNDHVLESSEEIKESEFVEINAYGQAFRKIVELKATGYLTHPEHGTITLAPGVYGFAQQQEYNPLMDQMQAVFD